MRKAATKRKRRARPALEFKPIDFGPVLTHLLEGFGFFMGSPEANRPVQVSPIPPEMFKKMLFLCHPDKHNNHAHAVEVTQWLLEERRKQQR